MSSCSQDTVGMTQTTSHRRWNYTDLLRIPCTMLRLGTTSSHQRHTVSMSWHPWTPKLTPCQHQQHASN